MHEVLRDTIKNKAIILEEGMKLAGVIHAGAGLPSEEWKSLAGEYGGEVASQILSDRVK